MSASPLRIAWLGPAPGGDAGVRAVATELLHGLAARGHTIDCFLPAAKGQSPAQIAGDERVTFGEGKLAFGERVTFVWGTANWQWGRWYSRGKVLAFASGMLARGLALFRLRREITKRHRKQPYDLIYQFSSVETLGVPAGVARSVPLVIHPETHIAGELRWLIAEWRLSLRCQPPYVFAMVAAIMSVRAIVQRRAIRKAKLLICISAVFRDHLVRDHGFPAEATVVVPNPLSPERFAEVQPQPSQPPIVLVLGRISARKGIEDVVAVARTLLNRGVDARVRVVGNPSLWSDYTKLLDDLPPENAEYAGHVAASEVPAELARSAILLQASKYEPFALTVAEALAAGVPVVGTSEVGAIERVDRAVATEVRPGDVEGMAAAIVATLDRLAAGSSQMRALARGEARRLFAPDVVCAQISAAIEELVERNR